MMADTSCALPCNVVRESSSRTYHLVQVSAGLALCHSDQSVNLATPCKTQTTDNPKPRQVRIFPEPHARGSRHLPQLQPEREQSGHGRNYIRGRGRQTMIFHSLHVRKEDLLQQVPSEKSDINGLVSPIQRSLPAWIHLASRGIRGNTWPRR